jgi:hypothetical protein
MIRMRASALYPFVSWWNLWQCLEISFGEVKVQANEVAPKELREVKTEQARASTGGRKPILLCGVGLLANEALESR